MYQVKKNGTKTILGKEKHEEQKCTARKEKGLRSDLINTKPAVRTIPPIAQETFSPNGISLTHCWKSSNILKLSPFRVNSNCEAFHESATEPRLALSP